MTTDELLDQLEAARRDGERQAEAKLDFLADRGDRLAEKVNRARDLCEAIITLEAGEVGNYSTGKYEAAVRILGALKEATDGR